MEDLATQQRITQWLEGPYDEETKTTIRSLLCQDPQQVRDAFFTHLTFGTGGLRGLMGVGTNRMNVYTIRAATQGLAHYILKQPSLSDRDSAVLIGYDSRHLSRRFAEEAAKVLAANEIQVYLFQEIRPTPLLSFGCRYKHCISAIMITASHNPPAYNGYKVYWSDGGQIVPPHDVAIMAEIIKITDPMMVKMVSSLSHPSIHEIGEELDQAYLKMAISLQHLPADNQRDGHQLKIVYTSLHGTGMTMVPKVLTAWGFHQLSFVAEQMIPDGDFPSTASLNPEEPAALQLGIDQMLARQADLLIATDPDGDRVGVACSHQGKAWRLTGHQIAALCLEHICRVLTQQNRLPSHAFFVKTIGTTELFQAICERYQRPCFNVLTGFKYIAAKIRERESALDQFIFGGEESLGYLFGSSVRDKDGILSSAFICEMALQAKLQGQTLVDRLYDLYDQYGIYQENLVSLNFAETKEGREQISKHMHRLREHPLETLADIPIRMVEDYLTLIRYNLKSGQQDSLQLPSADILVYWLEDGSKIIIRPSGTEPKIKLYINVVEKTFHLLEEGIQASLRRCKELALWLKHHLDRNL